MNRKRFWRVHEGHKGVGLGKKEAARVKFGPPRLGAMWPRQKHGRIIIREPDKVRWGHPRLGRGGEG